MRRTAPLLALLVLVPAAQSLEVSVPPVDLPVFGAYHLVCPLKSPAERCNTRLTIEAGPANEVMVASNPLNPAEFLAVAKDYDHAEPMAPSCVGTSFYHTVDGGRTWREGYVADPGLPCESDPVAAFDTDGVAWVNTLRISPRELVNYRPAGEGWVQQSRAPGFDKQWIGVNPLTGTLYLIDATNRFQRSTDGGATWSTSATGISGFAHIVAAAPSGRVVVTGLTGGNMISWVSTNDGLSFAGPFVISPVSFPYGGGLGGLGAMTARTFRTPPTFGMAPDPVSGRFWVAFPGVVPGAGGLPAPSSLGIDAWDVWLSHSDDGIAWSAPVRVNDDTPAAAQFFPQVAVSDDGVAHVAWMDQRLDPSGLTMNAAYAHSGDRGATWDANLLVSEQPSPVFVSFHQNPVPVVTNGWFVGDYIGLQASDDRAVVAFPDTRYGRADVFIATVQ